MIYRAFVISLLVLLYSAFLFTSLCFFFLFFLSFVVDIPLISFRRVLKTPTFPLSRPRVSRKAKSLVPGLYTALTLVQCTKFSQKNSTIFSALH
jgi:hypothetical protein